MMIDAYIRFALEVRRPVLSLVGERAREQEWVTLAGQKACHKSAAHLRGMEMSARSQAAPTRICDLPLGSHHSREVS